jgi:hypothetical protein
VQFLLWFAEAEYWLAEAEEWEQLRRSDPFIERIANRSSTNRNQTIIKKKRASDEVDFLGLSRFYRVSCLFGAVHR